MEENKQKLNFGNINGNHGLYAVYGSTSCCISHWPK